MINFIVCDDNEYVRDLTKKMILKFLMNYDFDYAIHDFNKYNSDLKKIISCDNDTKIYILDLELPGKSGMEIAHEIRKNDWDSFIIILTSHDELELRLLKEKLLILDFISKFDDIENKLNDTLKLIINKTQNNKSISFKYNGEMYRIKLSNILYICSDTLGKLKIITNDDSYVIRESLKNISKLLDNRFYKTHRACYINIDKVIKIDFEKDIIYLENGVKLDYLSRNYKKGLKERL